MGLRSLTLTAVAGLIVAACVLTTSRSALAGPGGEPASDARVPIPNLAVRKAGEKAVDDVFGADIAVAKTDAARAAVAKKIWDLAREEKDLSQRYVLLNRARKLAASAGDVHLALDAEKELVGFYRIDSLRAEVATIQAIEKAQLNSTQAAQLAVAAMKALDDAAARDDGEAIAELEAIAESAARKSGDADLSKQFATRHRQLKTIRDEADRIKPFRDKLAANAADPAANLEVGKHDCFAQRDWKTGLPMLVKGSDAALKEAAEADLASPTAPSAKLKVADLWWDLSEKEPEASYSRVSLRQRAAFWYREAAPALTGLAHLRAAKRAADVVESAPAGSSSAGSSETAAPQIPSGSSNAQHALVELASGQVKANKTVKSKKEPGFTLGNQPFYTVPDNGGLMIGLDVSLNSSGSKITGVRPLFATLKGQLSGPVVGQAAPNGTRLLAKKGYAIGAVTVAGGLGIDGLSVTFMKINADGLDTKKSYDSPWFGNATGGDRLGGDGVPIVGIYGHYDHHSVAALGIVQVEMPQPPAKTPGE